MFSRIRAFFAKVATQVDAEIERAISTIKAYTSHSISDVASAVRHYEAHMVGTIHKERDAAVEAIRHELRVAHIGALQVVNAIPTHIVDAFSPSHTVTDPAHSHTFIPQVQTVPLTASQVAQASSVSPPDSGAVSVSGSAQ